MYFHVMVQTICSTVSLRTHFALEAFFPCFHQTVHIYVFLISFYTYEMFTTVAIKLAWIIVFLAVKTQLKLGDIGPGARFAAESFLFCVLSSNMIAQGIQII